MKLLQSFKILQNLAADLGAVLALLAIGPGWVCFLLNIFIDHHTVNSHLLMHVYNTDTIYELNSRQKRSDIFTFTVPI